MNSRMICKYVLCVTSLIGFLAITEAAFAHRPQSVITDVTRAEAQALRDALTDGEVSPGEEAELLAFKVPAERTSRPVCVFANLKLVCSEEVTTSCPEALPVSMPDGNTTYVAVDCTGPDASGQCDCDFAQ